MGLPVFGSPYGDLPNLIHEKTGRIFECESDLLSFLKQGWKHLFDPKTIRIEAEKRFSIDVMNERISKYFFSMTKARAWTMEASFRAPNETGNKCKCVHERKK